jgi:hypothetical protein
VNFRTLLVSLMIFFLAFSPAHAAHLLKIGQIVPLAKTHTESFPTNFSDPDGLKCKVQYADPTLKDKFLQKLNEITGLKFSMDGNNLKYSGPRTIPGTDGASAQLLQQIIDNPTVTVQLTIVNDDPKVHLGSMYGYGQQTIDLADVTALNSRDSHRHGDGGVTHELAEAYYSAKYGLSNSAANYQNAHNNAGIKAENTFLKNTGGGVRPPGPSTGDFGTHRIVPGI